MVTAAVTVAAYLAVVLLMANFLPGLPDGQGAGPGAKPDAEPGTRQGMTAEPGAPRLNAVRRVTACVVVLAGFLFVPPGSLPPLCNLPWGGAVFLACLLTGRVLCGRFRLVPAMVLPAVFLVLVWYGWQRGIPGSPGNMGTYTAMPVWRLAEGADVAAFICLALASMFAAGPLVFPHGETMAGRLIRLGVCAFLVTLFLPWNTAPFVSWPAKITAGFDFVLFWIKCGMVMFCVARAGTIPWAASASVLCCITGGALLVSRIM